jgi:hypothetical protein
MDLGRLQISLGFSGSNEACRMSEIALYLFGPPRIELDDESVQVCRRNVVAPVTHLAVTRTSHSLDSVATPLWPERSLSRARAYLRRALSELNRTLSEGFLRLTARLLYWLAAQILRQALRSLLSAAHGQDRLFGWTRTDIKMNEQAALEAVCLHVCCIRLRQVFV